MLFVILLIKKCIIKYNFKNIILYEYIILKINLTNNHFLDYNIIKFINHFKHHKHKIIIIQEHILMIL